MHGIADTLLSAGRFKRREAVPRLRIGLLSLFGVLMCGACVSPPGNLTTDNLPRTFPSASKSPQEYQTDIANCKVYAIEHPASYGTVRVEASYAACMMMAGHSVQFADGSIRSQRNFQSAPRAEEPTFPTPTAQPYAQFNQVSPAQPREQEQTDASPPSQVHGLTYICNDGTVITIDVKNKVVRQIEHAGILFCRDTLVDGAVGPITTKEDCNYPAVLYSPEELIFKQSVTINKIWATWDAFVVGPPLYRYIAQNMSFTTKLNLLTGRGEGNGSTTQCHPGIG